MCSGIAVLISDSVHLIEFPSLLLPAGVGPGSIVNIACTRNTHAEKHQAREFWDLQRDIADLFGSREPQPPNLRVRNTTQTSVTLEWDKLDLASASLLNLSIYRNGQRLTTIPNPMSNTSTKLSGLSLDTDYQFHLVLKTSAGTWTSPTVKTRTHTIDNTTGISACFGLVEPADLAREAHRVIGDLGAKSDTKIQIDTTHYVATSAASPSAPDSGPSVEYQKAVQLSIPIVTPEWLLACARAHKLVPIAPYYLGHSNRAASLSSAQLVTSQGEPRSRPVAGAGAAATSSSRPQPVKEEQEPEQEQAQQQRDVIELQEDVEAPPDDSVVRNELEREPARASSSSASAPAPPPAVVVDSPEGDAAETDASTKGVKSDEDEASAAAPAPASSTAADEVPLAQATPPAAAAQDETEPGPADGGSAPSTTTSVPEVVVDAPAEELAREVEQGEVVPEGDAAAEQAEAVPHPVGTGEGEAEPKLDEAEEVESDVDEGQQVEGEGQGEGDASLVDVKL
ncbi:uncharacterized protein RHOBADRAFT_51806 [Rhodotorula graminis WP1]|uniref:Fibronectin type-III domain-containing protein n=1 Tax=Rhodotorula graminis (strain WP1) TaxID=578459 RepID=A0A194S898_RHOGW|nr:uncharacterized protein RHOBADRAFT_51806 [Rhodotorula graminis WP1]KPV76817.1 hypothetical protein RHOBADRAFT_51806 [Rhodotorula graminis WP1]